MNYFLTHSESPMDSQYHDIPRTLATRDHKYGRSLILLSNAFLLTKLARLCSPDCLQPEINRIIREIYRSLGEAVAHTLFPRAEVKIATRMATTHPKEGNYEGEIIDPSTRVVLVALARAGILPSMEIFDLYTSIFNQGGVRVDHLSINRVTNENHKVTDAPIQGSKIGGDIDGAYVILADPMGATGSSICNVIDLYKKEVKGKPKKWVSMNLIVTPEFVKRLKKEHPDVLIYALRLDRGFSSMKAFTSLPGEFPDEERGLNDHDYIVPGGGGFGEISNNSFV